MADCHPGPLLHSISEGTRRGKGQDLYKGSRWNSLSQPNPSPHSIRLLSFDIRLHFLSSISLSSSPCPRLLAFFARHLLSSPATCFLRPPLAFFARHLPRSPVVQHPSRSPSCTSQ